MKPGLGSKEPIEDQTLATSKMESGLGSNRWNLKDETRPWLQRTNRRSGLGSNRWNLKDETRPWLQRTNRRSGLGNLKDGTRLWKPINWILKVSLGQIDGGGNLIYMFLKTYGSRVHLK